MMQRSLLDLNRRNNAVAGIGIDFGFCFLHVVAGLSQR